jgi:hypothetical protein
MVAAYLRSGGVGANVEASDIGLFSTVIGSLASGRPLAELGIRFETTVPDPPRLEDDLDLAAQVMLALKLGQLRPSSQHGINHRRQLCADWPRQHQVVRDQVEQLVGSIAGSSYAVRDLWDVVEEAAEDPDACLAVNVPTYSGGYRRMFAGSGIAWDEPSIPEFDPKTYERLIERLDTAKCAALVYCQRETTAIPESWKVLFAQPYSTERIDTVVANRDLGVDPYAVPENKAVTTRRFPIYNEEEIASETRVSFVRVDAETCLYYRDLFVHKLGVTRGESYFLMLLDGRVVTASGSTRNSSAGFRATTSMRSSGSRSRASATCGWESSSCCC